MKPQQQDQPTPLWTRQPDFTGTSHADSDGRTRYADGSHSDRLYLDHMPAELREAFEAASADPDLKMEIRLMRAVLSVLSQDFRTNSLGMTRVLTALLRALESQAKQMGSSDAVEQILLYAGDAQIPKEEKC